MAAEPSGPIDCPDILPLDQVTDGMLATGWTVVDSETPESFGVEVLGILENGIAPGRDMIVVEVSGPVITENGGGIWFGMSGSPVYHDGDLLGAVAYGLSFGPSNIGGLTPAEQMDDIPGSSEATVALSRADRRRIAAAAGTSTQEVGENFVQLKTPFSIAGVSARVRNKVVKRAIEREELPLVPYAGGTTPSGDLETTDTPPSAGQSIAAALSYGDVSFTGVGTTTFVCDGRAAAFGHPFMFTGDAGWGAARAEAITVVADPVYGSFKLANIDATFGTIDQDRLAGIAGDVGAPPPVVPIRSTMTDLDLGRSRDGTTLGVQSDFLPFIALSHLLSNADVTIDRIGKGSSWVTWTLHGTTEDGDPWSVSRRNRFTSDFDISYETLFEVEEAIYRILFNRFEQVELGELGFEAEFDKQVKEYQIDRAVISRNGGYYKDVRRMRVKPGDVLRVHTIMFDENGDRRITSGLFTVPQRFRRGTLSVTGGEDEFGFFECFSEFDECFGGESGGKISTFEGLLNDISSEPKNSQVVMTLRSNRPRHRDIQGVSRVVTGRDSFRLTLKGQKGGGGSSGAKGENPVNDG
jgi:hypothetical protein